jgi:hypothetical protein
MQFFLLLVTPAFFALLFQVLTAVSISSYLCVLVFSCSR